MPDVPEVRRVSYTDHAAKVVADHPDRDAAGSIARDAAALAPLQAIQVAYDQVVSTAASVRRGEPFSFMGGFPGYTRDVGRHVGRLRDVLRTAADAADSMIAEMSSQLSAMEAAMSAENPNEGPQLTTSGGPHPLQEGGYDPNADPGLPGNISDVEALKEGRTTRQQAEALAAADVEAGPSPPAAPPQAPTPPVPKAGPQVPASEIPPPRDEPKPKGKR